MAELRTRIARLLGIMTLCIVVGWYWIDPFLEAYLSELSPCNDCLIVYSPTEWVGLRWLSILLFACLLSTPFAFREIIRFSEPGLTLNERHWLRRLFASGLFVGGGVVGITLGIILPDLFFSAENAGQIQGVIPRYSAAAMLAVALVIAWVELIVILATVTAILLSRFGLTRGTQMDIWRLRLHSASIFLLWLVVPSGFGGILIASIIAAIGFAELGFQYAPLNTRAAPRLRASAGVFDSESRLRRIAVVDCSCAGANPASGVDTLPDYTLGLNCKALCLNGEERDMLIETARMNRLSDIYITGCDSTPIPSHLGDSLQYLDCSLRGLSMMDIESLRESSATVPGLQLNILFASQTDPWPTGSCEQRRLEVLQRMDIDGDVRQISEADVGRLGITLQSNEIFIPK